MNNDVMMAGDGVAAGPGLRLRVPAVVVALALVFCGLFLVQHKAEASTVRAAVATAPAAPAANAQINFNQFVCAILLQIRAAFASSPFFAVVVAALNPILIAFGCITSQGVPIP